MHSYQHNIKTFSHATRSLTRVQRSLYRDLIELYYDSEQPLPANDFNELCRDVLAFTDDEKTDVKYILGKFFILTGDVYTHVYCDEQIEKYRSISTAKSMAGKASAEAKKNRAQQIANARSTRVQQNSTNNKPLTINHKPITIKQEPLASKDSAYAFVGQTIKITDIDYKKLTSSYPNLDLQKELKQLDLELINEKKWWAVMNAKLNYRNKMAIPIQPVKTSKNDFTGFGQ
jgi:uncharacterized protein YdaU (DUF1376 family)